MQSVLLTTVSATSQVINADTLPELDYDSLHEAGGVLSIEGDAEISDVGTCMAAVYQTMEVLPAEHVEALNDLTLVFEEGVSRGQAGGDMMRLRCVDMTESELVAVFIHEMGHVVDTGMLESEYYAEAADGFWDGRKPVYSDDLSVDYYGISWLSNIEYGDEVSEHSFVSGYAGTDPFEDFAESYLMYVLHGESFKYMAQFDEDLAVKYEFMRNYIFDGVEYVGIDLNQADPYGRVFDANLLEFDLEKFWSM